ncbi:MAG: hypothetical protein AAF530_17845 [Pseudomonadota bacterium]
MKKNRTVRHLRDIEKSAVLRLLEPDIPLKRKILQQLEGAKVRPVNSDESIIEFILKDYWRPTDIGQQVWPVEGVIRKPNDETVFVLLFLDPYDHLFELEFYGFENFDVTKSDIAAMKLIY